MKWLLKTPSIIRCRLDTWVLGSHFTKVCLGPHRWPKVLAAPAVCSGSAYGVEAPSGPPLCSWGDEQAGSVGSQRESMIRRATQSLCRERPSRARIPRTSLGSWREWLWAERGVGTEQDWFSSLCWTGSSPWGCGPSPIWKTGGMHVTVKQGLTLSSAKAWPSVGAFPPLCFSPR